MTTQDLTPEQRNTLARAAAPLMDWLASNKPACDDIVAAVYADTVFIAPFLPMPMRSRTVDMAAVDEITRKGVAAIFDRFPADMNRRTHEWFVAEVPKILALGAQVQARRNGQL